MRTVTPLSERDKHACDSVNHKFFHPSLICEKQVNFIMIETHRCSSSVHFIVRISPATHYCEKHIELCTLNYTNLAVVYHQSKFLHNYLLFYPVSETVCSQRHTKYSLNADYALKYKSGPITLKILSIKPKLLKAEF